MAGFHVNNRIFDRFILFIYDCEIQRNSTGTGDNWCDKDVLVWFPFYLVLTYCECLITLNTVSFLTDGINDLSYISAQRKVRQLISSAVLLTHLFLSALVLFSVSNSGSLCWCKFCFNRLMCHVPYIRKKELPFVETWYQNYSSMMTKNAIVNHELNCSSGMYN